MHNKDRLISANALLALYDLGEELEEYVDTLSVPITVIRQNIKDMPTVDAVDVAHGRWIHQEEYIRGISDHQYVCSVCGHLYWNARIPNFKYCPNCGAKMDGDGNG